MTEIDDSRRAPGRRTRDAVLEATRGILESDGFEALTMGAVATRAGISLQAVHLQFGSRAELVDALFDYLTDQEGLHDTLAPVYDAPGALAALRAWAWHLAVFYPRLTTVAKAIARVRDIDADAARFDTTIAEKQLSICRMVAGRLDEEGRLAAPWTADMAADMLWAFIATDLFERVLARPDRTPEQTAEDLRVVFESTFVRSAGEHHAELADHSGG